ncbi:MULTISPECIES: MarR family winged helix-turn-helix transcriptional regulator [Nocardia]|uniref:MarR family transcriptional regulator n=1 Tax=Nocardia aurea TaxID=2144174 RepID=A0ABV3FRR4_9NOCA|nr:MULTISPECIES: MarR family transcriptional regulator [Nocardia]
MATTTDPALATAFSALHRELGALYSLIARSFGLTTQQIELLCQLDGHTPTFGELATLLGCDKTNVTGMVDRLERRGFLTRQADPADRRVTRAALTPHGIALRAEIRAVLEQELTDRLPTADRAELLALVTAAAAALAETR